MKLLPLILLILINISLANAKCITTILNPMPDETNGKYNFLPTKYKNFAWLDSKEGRKRFSNSEYKGDFFRLVHHFSPQSTGVTCGIASAMIVIRAIYQLENRQRPYHHELSAGSDARKIYFPYHGLVEDDFFIEKVNKIKTKEEVLGQTDDCKFSFGVELPSYAELIKQHDVDVQEFRPKLSGTIEDFRNTVKKTMLSEKSFLISLYRAHVSPIVAYDQKTDSVLVMDTMSNDNDWYWEGIPNVYDNMKEYDFTGYVVVSSIK